MRDVTCPTKSTKDHIFLTRVPSIAVTFVCHSHHSHANERSCCYGTISRCFYLGENVGEETLEEPRGRSTTAIAWPLTRRKESTQVVGISPENWGSSVAARSSANLFVIERSLKAERGEKKRRRTEPGSSSSSSSRNSSSVENETGKRKRWKQRSCFAYRRIYEPVEPVVSLSPEGKFQPPNSGLWYRRKVATLCFSPSSSFSLSMQHGQSAFSVWLFLSLSPSLSVSRPFLVSYRRIYRRHRLVHCNEDCLRYWLFLLC